MRLKNIKGARGKVEVSSYVILEPNKYKGKYHELFNNNNPIRLEIGMGKGKFLIESAKKYPDINFLGIEKYDSVLIRAVEKLEELDLPNIKLIKADAFLIDTFFDKEIDLIYLNFSDPWPKKRHEKRRLTSLPFLEKYDYLFFKKPHIIMKTDNRHFFEYSIKSLTDYGYKINSISLDLYADEELLKDNIATEYEEKFHSKGSKIYKIDVYK
ncbi:MAG: tRNA (guanosine(46)-N7)-methyltransferase TrmB [Mollicutes bacterium]|nr:tRNA (guanosine(46)-N7)-methyltransferase TrmB [Mollicutes bacterium]